MAKAAPTDEAETRGKFRVNERSFIGHALIEEGGTAWISPDDLKVKGKADGHIGENLSPMNDIAQAMVDGQKEPHPDKGAGKPAKASRAAKDAPAAPDGGAAGDGGGDDDLG